MTQSDIITAILAERKAQAERWNKPHEWGFGDCSNERVAENTKAAVLCEECGEVSRAVLEKDEAQLKRELIQVAAVAMAWLEGMK